MDADKHTAAPERSRSSCRPVAQMLKDKIMLANFTEPYCNHFEICQTYGKLWDNRCSDMWCVEVVRIIHVPLVSHSSSNQWAQHVHFGLFTALLWGAQHATKDKRQLSSHSCTLDLWPSTFFFPPDTWKEDHLDGLEMMVQFYMMCGRAVNLSLLCLWVV